MRLPNLSKNVLRFALVVFPVLATSAAVTGYLLKRFGGYEEAFPSTLKATGGLLLAITVGYCAYQRKIYGDFGIFARDPNTTQAQAQAEGEGAALLVQRG